MARFNLIALAVILALGVAFIALAVVNTGTDIAKNLPGPMNMWLLATL